MSAAILIVASVLLVLLILFGTGRAADLLAMPPEERRRFTGRAGTMTLAWVAFVAIAGASGFLSDFVALPPRLLLFLLVILVSAVIFARSPVGRLLETLPFSLLVGFHGFRILAELALYYGFVEGRFPVQMTFEGMNFDIVSGISALALAPLLAKRPLRPLIWAWSVMATVLLMTIVTIAVLSAPTPLRHYFNEPANTAVAHFPYVLLPGMLVWAAIVGHLLIYQKLLARE